MAQSRLEHFVDIGWPVEPIEECRHFSFEPCRGRRDKMNALLADRSRNNLHRTRPVVAPSADRDFRQAAAACWKQRCVPREEPFRCQRLIVAAGGVEHHFDKPLDVAVSGLWRADASGSAIRSVSQRTRGQAFSSWMDIRRPHAGIIDYILRSGNN